MYLCIIMYHVSKLIELLLSGELNVSFNGVTVYKSPQIVAILSFIHRRPQRKLSLNNFEESYKRDC